MINNQITNALQLILHQNWVCIKVLIQGPTGLFVYIIIVIE